MAAMPFFANGQTFKNIPQNWQRDIEYVQTTLPENHPDWFRLIPKKTWDSELKNLSERVGRMSDLEVALALQAIISKAGDPHTHLNLTPLLQKEAVIPVGLGWYDGGLYVSGSVRRFDKVFGTKILKINGVDAKEAMERVARYIPRDNEIGYRNAALQLLRFPTVLRSVGLATTDTMEVLAENAVGEQFLYKTFPLDVANDRQGMQPITPYRLSPDTRFQPIKSSWSWEWLPADSLLVVQYNRCRSREMMLAAGDTTMAMQLPAFQPFLDSVFTHLDYHPNARLLIDLRFNGGGGASDGLAWAERLSNSAFNRKGQVFVAINAFTTSAATQVATFFDRDTEAILIGEPTGDRPNHFGEMRTMTLPNSGLRLNFSSKFMRILRDKDPDTLAPEIPVPLTFQNFMEGRDPVLAYLRGMKK